jgi:SAM-dependent methyltransferase
MNSEFFAQNAAYAARIGNLETYANIRHAVNGAIAGGNRLLDIGNGGVFDYDTSLVDEIVGVDLFLDQPPSVIPANVTLRQGDALDLDERDGDYDHVLLVSVFHHLVGENVEQTVGNIRQSISEARRVLIDGGRLVVMESCTANWAYVIERRLFTALCMLSRTRLMKHPPVLQFPPDTILALLKEHFENVTMAPIPAGRTILQFGHRWPTALTPARPYLFTAA